MVYNLQSGTCSFENLEGGPIYEYRADARSFTLAARTRHALSGTAPLPLWLRPEANGVVRVCRLTCDGCVLADVLPAPAKFHKTTIQRRKISRPIKCALRDGLITPKTTVLDYGCGSGYDVEVLRSRGIPAVGWDPVSFPDTQLEPADVVNLGYVLNIIDDREEQVRVLRHAHSLARRLLIVSAQIHNGVATKRARAIPFKDGIVTGKGTYQRYFKLRELRMLVHTTLAQNTTSSELGVLYVSTKGPHSSSIGTQRERGEVQ